MYRTYEEILQSMIDKKTTPRNATRYIYNYKKQKKYDLAVMWYKAKIVYEGEHGSKEDN